MNWPTVLPTPARRPGRAPPEFAPGPTVTEFVAPGSVLPAASWITTSIAGVITAPAAAFVGCWANASVVAGAPATNVNITACGRLLATLERYQLKAGVRRGNSSIESASGGRVLTLLRLR